MGQDGNHCELNLLHSHTNKKVVLLSLDDSTIPVPLSSKRKAVLESEGSEIEAVSEGSDTEQGSSKEDNVRNHINKSSFSYPDLTSFFNLATTHKEMQNTNKRRFSQYVCTQILQGQVHS